MLFLQKKNANMQDHTKNNFISIAKAIGIILMVAGHSGCPAIMNRFLYLFHMPLFFVCSGYFFKDIKDTNTLTRFYKRKTQGLYIPYLKWSLLFLLFHNIFVASDIIHSEIYDLNNYTKQILNICIMKDFDILIRPFWFIKELLLSSILIATLSYLRHRYAVKFTNVLFAAIFLILTMLCKFHNINFPVLGDVSILTLSITYICAGMLYRQYENKIKPGSITCIICFVITITGSFLFNGEIDMRYTTISNVLPYFILSFTGIFFIFSVSKYINLHVNDNHYIYFIGNHTMPILALNLLTLKIGNLIKIQIYDMPMESLASHTIIYDHNQLFWILYIIIGVSIPLLLEHMYLFFINKMKINQ